MTRTGSGDVGAMHVLAGDIGGTKSLLCIGAIERGRARVVRQERLENATFSDFDGVLRAFLDSGPVTPIAAGCLAFAGPVYSGPRGQRVRLTNLPWEIDGAVLAEKFGIARLRMVNDFVAIGYAIDTLTETELVTLNRGEPEEYGPRAVIGAGTGLGQAILVWQGDHYEVVATEGSKADFGPTDALQLDLARYLMERNGRASYELILSGSGLVRVYEFLRERGAAPESAAMQQALQRGEPAAEVTRAAMESSDALANATLDLFISIYGAQAGNLALTAGATGGVYVAGGIAPRIVSRMTGGAFMSSFINKGKMTGYMRPIPVHVVTNTEIGLAGALAAAARLAQAG